MTTKKTSLNTTIDPTILFLLIAILIGGYIRLSPVLQSAVPLNDGGLFYQMTQDLMDNDFNLPAITSYNQLDIPFAYPPLSFYLAGLLAKITGWALLDIVRILPAVFTVLTIPAFYLLAKRLVSDPYQLIFATLIFNFIPSSFDWMIMGGGLTRSAGFFFFLLSLTFIHRMYTRKHWLDVLWAALFSSLTVLSHPEAALYAVASALVFFFFFGKNRQGIWRSLAVAGLVLTFSAPWWLSVVRQYGVAPFFAAGGTGQHNLSQAIYLFQVELTHEYGLQTISALGLAGLFMFLLRKQFFLPLWFAVIFLVEPRSAPRYESICLALLAGITLANVMRWMNQRLFTVKNTELQLLSDKKSRWLLLLLFVQWIFSAGTVSLSVSNNALSTFDLTAFSWIANNTPAHSDFLILTGNLPFTDPVAEWFPALTERKSVATIQGEEWQRNDSFKDVINQSIAVQSCIAQSYECLQNWSEQNQIDFEYIYLHLPGESAIEPAFGELARLQGFMEPIYQADGVFVYRVR